MGFRQVRVTLLAARRGDLKKGDSFFLREDAPEVASYRNDPAWRVQTVAGTIAPPVDALREGVIGAALGHALRQVIGEYAEKFRKLTPEAQEHALAALAGMGAHRAPLSHVPGSPLALEVRLVGGPTSSPLQAEPPPPLPAEPETTPEPSEPPPEAQGAPGSAPPAPPVSDAAALDALRAALADGSRATVAQVLGIARRVPVPAALALGTSPRKADLWATCAAFLDLLPSPPTPAQVDPSDLGEE